MSQVGIVRKRSTSDEAPAKKPRKQRSLRFSPERAVLAITSWSDAIGLKWQKAYTDRLTVRDVHGQDREVIILDTPAPHVADPKIIYVNGPALLNGSGFETFAQMTQALGFGPWPVPVNRGAMPDERVSFRDDMDLVAMRHGLLRTSPNLPQYKIAPYRDVIENCTSYYFKKFRRFFDLFGYNVHDILTYTNMWFLIFHHHYRKLNGTVDENRKLLTRYLQGSFINFGTAVQSKASGCFPEGDSVTVAFYEDHIGKPNKTVTIEGQGPQIPYHVAHDYDKAPETHEDHAYQLRRNMLNKETDAKRRKSAATLLDTLLGSMEHDVRVSLLRDAETNEAFDHDTRAEAKKQLRRHTNSCSTCVELAPATENGIAIEAE